VHLTLLALKSWTALAPDTFQKHHLFHPELRLPLVMLQTVALALEMPQGASFPLEDRVAIASLLKTFGQRTRLPRQPLKKKYE
jgi:hypothetical protein